MAAGSTYTLISSYTLTDFQAIVTFSSIPQTYTDLVLVTSTNGTRPSGDIHMQLNGDTGTNYSHTMMQGLGASGTWVERGTSMNYVTCANNVGEYGYSYYIPTIINFLNYSNTTTNKVMLIRQDGVISANVQARVALWRSTSAITTITLILEAGGVWSYSAGSTFSLYGIAAA